MQLSWNYNYFYAGADLNVDLCTNPDLVATDEEVNWGTAIWFWTTSTGSTGTTCKEYVEAGSFGGTVKTIVSYFVGR
jgi:predicted chitinase